MLVVQGIDDGRPDPWQSHWLRHRPSFRRVAAPANGGSDLNRWAAAVAMAIDVDRAPPLVVAHGYGVLATLRATFMFERRLAGAMLVAPADPDRHAALARLPATPLPYPSLLVASRDDPCRDATAVCSAGSQR